MQSIRTQIIVKTKKVKEAEKFVSQKIFEYDNCQISEYDYVILRGDQIGLFKLVTLNCILNRITGVTFGC
jgi:hypothetical protein